MGALSDDALARMQLVALAGGAAFERRHCCFCVPLAVAGVLVCLFLIIRGALEIFEATHDVVFSSTVAGNRWAPWARGAVFYAGVGDIIFALACIAGVLSTAAKPVGCLALWISARVPLVLFVTIVTAMYDTANYGVAWTVVAFLLNLAIELCLLMFAIQLTLEMTLHGTIHPTALQAIEDAKRFAAERGCREVCRADLLAGLLQDNDNRNFLEIGGIDVLHVSTVLLPNSRLDPEDDHRALPMAEETVAVLQEALHMQRECEESMLMGEHILLAFCEPGEITLGKALAGTVSHGAGALAAAGASMVASSANERFTLDPELVRRRVALRRRRSVMVEGARLAEPGSGTILGCLPLEVAAALMVFLKIVLCILCICGFNLLGFLLVGRTHMTLVHVTDALLNVAGIALGILALAAIWGHSVTRSNVRAVAQQGGVSEDAPFSQALEAIGSYREAKRWRKAMKRSGQWLALYICWAVVEMLVSIPLVGMRLAAGDVCDAYSAGSARVATAVSPSAPYFSATPAAPLHCDKWDHLVIELMVVAAILEIVACWVIFVLWHQYAHGWTSTDPWDVMSLDPFGPPDSISRALAGLPPRQQRKAGPAGEATPLLT